MYRKTRERGTETLTETEMQGMILQITNRGVPHPEVGIYKRKQELDQESDQEKKKKLSFFLDHFLGRVLVFFLFSCFLTFLFSFLILTSG